MYLSVNWGEFHTVRIAGAFVFLSPELQEMPGTDRLGVIELDPLREGLAVRATGLVVRLRGHCRLQ